LVPPCIKFKKDEAHFSRKGQNTGNGIVISNSIIGDPAELEALRIWCISDPGNAEEIFSDAPHIKGTFKMLSAADEGLLKQNQDLIISQRTLSESEESYHAFIAFSSEGIWRLDQPNPCP
jgi:hypothetical protein